MRRISVWALSTLSAVVLLFGYSTSTSGPATTTTSSFVSGATAGEPLVATSSSTPSASTSTDASAGTSTPAATPAATTTTTLTGDVAQTRWGPVQVELTMTDGEITDVSVLQYPQGNGRDVEINNQALPVLIDETTQAQSADIDVVSGATVTSDGYLQSLQSALDQA